MVRYLIFLLYYLFSAATVIGQMPKMIKNIGPKGTHGINVGWNYPNVFANASGKLLFWGTDESNGTELWVMLLKVEIIEIISDEFLFFGFKNSAKRSLSG